MSVDPSEPLPPEKPQAHEPAVRPDAQPLDQPRPVEPHDGPHEALNIPMARPVAAEWLAPPSQAVEPAWGADSRLSPWRAAAQLLLMLVVVVAAALIGTAVASVLRVSDQRWHDIVGTAFIGTACVLAALVMARGSGRAAASIGWHTDNLAANVGIGVLTAFLVLLGLTMVSIVIYAFDPDMSRSEHTREAIQKALPPMSIPGAIVMMAFVGIWEETLFRGFLLTRLHAILRRWWLAVPVGAALFATGHGYQGRLAMVMISGLGVILGVVFVWRKSLVPCIVCHMIFDLVMVFALRLASPGWR